MTWEPLLIILLLATVLVLAVTRSAGTRTAGRVLLVLLVVASVGAAIVDYDRSPAIDDLPKMRPTEFADEEYRSSSSCQVCHPSQYRSWHASYHRTMTQAATAETVIGDFDNVSLDFQGLGYQLYRGEQGEFMVAMEIVDPQTGGTVLEHRPIVMTTGSHHMQVYWFSLGRLESRLLGMLPFVYLVPEKRWIPRHAAFLMPEERNPENVAGRWNATCIRCHTTNPKARAENPSLQPVDSQTTEFGIACEACHGPGHHHLAANANPLDRYRRHLGNGEDDSITNPAKLDHHLSSQVCGSCHSVSSIKREEDFLSWHRDGPSYRPGQELADSRHLVRARKPDEPMTQKLLAAYPHTLEDSFWSDGMLRVSGREYTALQDSPCHQHGNISCLSCHEMHSHSREPDSLKSWRDDQLKQGMRSNQACLQCHEELESEKQLTAHTHHPAASSGSLCYNCHMPHTTYGLLKAIRSHQVDSPDVAVSLETGRPNACNQCHLDKSLGWSADALERWYQVPRPALSEEQEQVAASVLWLLKGDAGQRALMAWSYSWGSALEASGDNWQAPFLSVLMEDPYQAVRFIAGRSLHSLPDFARIGYDFLESEEEVGLHQLEVIDTWKKLPVRPGGEAAAAILVDPQGELMWERIKQLHSQRDDRRVNLVE